MVAVVDENGFCLVVVVVVTNERTEVKAVCEGRFQIIDSAVVVEQRD